MPREQRKAVRHGFLLGAATRVGGVVLAQHVRPRPVGREDLGALPGPLLRNEIWGDVGRCGEIWGDVGRCGEMWGDVGRCGEICSGRSLERTRPPRYSAAPRRLHSLRSPSPSRSALGALPEAVLPPHGLPAHRVGQGGADAGGAAAAPPPRLLRGRAPPAPVGRTAARPSRLRQDVAGKGRRC